MALGERVESGEWLTYIPIWLAVLLLVVEGILHLKQQQLKKYELANKAAQLEKIRKNNE